MNIQSYFFCRYEQSLSIGAAFILLAIVCSGVAAAGSASAHAAAETTPPLAADAAPAIATTDLPELLLPATDTAAVPDGRWLQRGYQPVKLNRQILSTPAAAGRLQFSPPGRIPYTLIHDRRIHHAGGNVTWIGHLQDHGNDYRAIITWGPNAVFGSIQTPDGLFLLQPAQNQSWLIDVAAAGLQMPSLENDTLIPPLPAPVWSSPAAAEPSPALSLTAAAPSVIDLLILYTPGLVQTYGEGLTTRFDHLLATANQAYIDSGVAITLRRVATLLVDYPDNTSNNDALNALTNGADGFANIELQRSQVEADLVTLIRPYQQATQNGCGIAWVNGSGGCPRLCPGSR